MNTQQQQVNPSFVPDEDTCKNDAASYNFADGREQTKNGAYVLEMKTMKKMPDEDYDPHKNRDVDHPTTNLDTFFHLLKGSLGTGILAMPNAFYHSGYVVGTVGTIFLGALCTYCIQLLVKSNYKLCKRKKIPSMSYPETAKAALEEGPPLLRPIAPSMVHVVNIFLLIYQMGICCVYIVFVSANIQKVMNAYVEEISVRYYMLMFLIPFIAINWIRNLKFLAPVSTAANGITFVTFGVIAYYIFREPISFDDREMVGKLEHFPLFFGTVLFALEAIGVMLPLENEMKNPRSFGGWTGILNRAMAIIILLYAAMGFCGYLKYGADAEGSITLNLPEKEVLSQIVVILLAAAIFMTHPLQCYIAIDILWSNYVAPKLEKSEHLTFWEYFLRTSVVIFTFLLAVAIPNLELFISLFGALCLSALGLAIPAIIESCTYWYDLNSSRFALMIVKNVFLILFGICGLVIGTYTSIRDIVVHFS